MAVARQLALGRRAAFLVPTRALAEQKLAEFEAWLAPAGLRAICATRERPESDPLVARGEFDLLVAVHEKLGHHLILNPQIAAGLGVVVVDEIQTLGDPERGATLDLLLTGLRLSPYPTRIVALGSSMPGSTGAALAGALGAELIVEARRPRELREGALDLATGLFHYREASEGGGGTELIAAPERLAAWAGLAARALEEAAGAGDACAAPTLAAAAELAARGEPTLVFAPTRATSRAWAAALAAMELGLPPARVALARLDPSEAGASAEMLRGCLEAGVAFHNADLPEEARALVEAAFADGEARVVVSTSTLGLGVNLAGRNVVQAPWRVGREAASGKPMRVPLGRSRFAGHGGRAARFGLGEGFGRSMAVGVGAEPAARLMAELALAPPEAIEPPLAGAPFEDAALALLAGAGRTAENLADAFGQSVSAALASFESLCRVGFAPGPEEAARALDRCGEARLARREATGIWRLTGLGEVAAAQGISCATADAFARGIERGLLRIGRTQSMRSEIDVLLAVALTDEGRRACDGLAVSDARLRREAPALMAALRDAAGMEDESGARTEEGDDTRGTCSPTMRLLTRAGGPSRGELAAARAALMMRAWSEGEPVERIEARFGVFGGAVARAAGDFRWLVAAMAAAAGAMGRPEAEVHALRALAERVGHGLPDEALGLARLRARSVGRRVALLLIERGCSTPEAVISADADDLAEWIGQDAARSLVEAARRREAELARPGRVTRTASSSPSLAPARATAPPAAPSAPTHPTAHQPAPPTEPTKAPPSTQPTISTFQPTAPSLSRELIEINLRSPGLIKIGGRDLALPPLCFEFLAALAERPGEVVTRQAVYQRLWPEGGPEEQQLDAHRRRMETRLAPALKPKSGGLVQVVRGIGFRLARPPETVRLTR